MLTEQNWPQMICEKNWKLAQMPYLLQLYDSNKFYGMPGLHINRLDTGGFSIPVPYSQQMKIHDLLDYIGIENNTSFYIN
jgi:hypothetical protein